jgi:hypothetical protein
LAISAAGAAYFSQISTAHFSQISTAHFSQISTAEGRERRGGKFFNVSGHKAKEDRRKKVADCFAAFR